MREKAFCRVLKFPDPASRHLDHVLRRRVDKEGLEGPDQVVIMGDIGCIPKPRELPGKVKNRYMEIVVSGIDLDQVPALQEYFQARYERPQVPAVFHRDEAHPHVHLLVPWINRKGRALRFPRSEFNAVRVQAARIVGHEATRVGQGRRRISMKRWQADEDDARAKAETMTEADRGKLDEVRQLLRIYGSISVYGVRHDGARETLQERIHEVDGLSLKRLHLMARRGYTIHFCCADPGKAPASVAFLDRVPESQVKKMPGNAVIVRAAGGHYQAHIPVDQRLNTPTLRELEAWLAANHEARTQQNPLPVLPGFAVAGSRSAAIVAATNSNPPVSYARYVKSSQREAAILNEHRKAIRQAGGAQGYLASTVKRTWAEVSQGDAGLADHRYASYLLAQGLSDEDAAHWLITQSPRIIARHGASLDQYVRRVLDGARAHLYNMGSDAMPSV